MLRLEIITAEAARAAVPLIMAMLVKICGLSTAASVAAAIEAGADMVGFVFFPRSPRNVTLAAAAALAAQAQRARRDRRPDRRRGRRRPFADRRDPEAGSAAAPWARDAGAARAIARQATACP